MSASNLKQILEALIFAAEEPLGLATLTAMVEELGADRNAVRAELDELAKEYNEFPTKGLMLREVGGAYQFVTRPEVAAWVAKLNAAKPKSLSQAALETLAIVAYRQPIVRSEVEAIRSVDTGGVLKTLLERGLIRILGRREEAGQPLIYGTTPAFMELFHLKNLEELPSMRDIEQLVDRQNAGQQTSAGAEDLVDAAASEEAEELSAEESILSSEELGDESEAIQDLESSLKDLRRLEKEVFPREEKSEDSQPVSEEPFPEKE